MKCLHLASFIGNIGDNASHQGFYSILDTFFPKYTIEQVEIRRLYKNYKHSDKLKFDENFIAYANTFDLFIIGGGGFLDYWVDGSQTGTTLDISPSLVQKIKVPTLITSVGCMPNKLVPDGNVEKFRTFLDAILSNPNIKLAVRNDGSVLSIERDIGKHYLDYIPEVLDSGFFYKAKPVVGFPVHRDYAAINITIDQLMMAKEKNHSFDLELYYEQLAASVDYLVKKLGLDIIFIPHIYSDLEAISQLIKRLDDFLVRSHISVAPYIQSDGGANYLFSIYQQSNLVIGTRFHANVCSMAMGKKVIGLSLLERLSYVYTSLGCQSCNVLPTGEFSERLGVLASELNSSQHAASQLMANIGNRKLQTLGVYKDSLNSFSLI